MLEWISYNKEWILNGIGVFVLASFTSVLTFVITTVIYKKHKERKDEKVAIFRHLIATQAFLDYGKVKALNSIEVVFHDNQEIVKAWRDYKASLKIDTEKATQQQKDLMIKNEKLLLEKMAKHLKFKNITWDIIKDPYYPRWISESEQGTSAVYQFVQQAPNMLKAITGSKGSNKKR